MGMSGWGSIIDKSSGCCRELDPLLVSDVKKGVALSYSK
jgi:hypothetical protein